MSELCKVYCEDSVIGMQSLESNSIDLVFTDPPYGIKGNLLNAHYNRDESTVIEGYQEVALEEYAEFSRNWISEASRVLRPGGTFYCVSGYTNLHHVLNALHATKLQEVNHLIAEYTFGVYTKNKWVSSHYHLLCWEKPGKKRTFNRDAYYSDTRQSYQDRLSVQKIKREYNKQKIKNKNQLPVAFVERYIRYSSHEGDWVLDPFSGSFSTAKAALQNNRKFIGYEKNKTAYNYFTQEINRW